ncbi:hypothetical protein CHGG_07245 [Chaetomium globosum CBS 148.51]|uniref:Oxidoreductase AflY n=1 Tax=Chaetomium globosum (strain ATCC 6205 / CBS 148.51 / DSM 1962 / NBRC 6347 / NRRL 1970) TaxID=306901 RepID=Q2GXQ9_CHAGB|nr:uncharacterized protein CHGG_07245 [Chaetomium globosum CBS 148.51]EAQ85992.1 hypothetical protein CHGG_07245 [Chaetomium globosum CBS 148.51]
MASTADLPYKMRVTPDNTGLWHIKQTDEAAKKVSELLQEDMEVSSPQAPRLLQRKNTSTTHIPHHLLALYGTGAAPSALQAAYRANNTYQRPALAPHTPSLAQTQATFHPWPAAARPRFGDEAYYPDFLRFFQAEMKREGGWKNVVGRYLFGLGLGVDKEGDGVGGGGGDELLVRLFAGILHPLIQLMYGVEWGQEAVVAEGLAQAAVHSGDLGRFLLAAEEKARAAAGGGKEGGVGVLELMAEIRRDPKLKGAARDSDPEKIRDGVFARAREEMIALAARVRVRPDEVEEKTAEMFDAAVYVAAAAAVMKEGKQPKFDFFFMHHVNSSPFFVAINAQDWIPAEAKARLLEWKIRMDLLQYAARGAPELSVEKLAAYQPRKPKAGGSLADIVARLHTYEDDGHSIKLARAAVICRNICKKYEDEGKGWLKVKGDDMWSKVCHLIVDSVEAPGERWLRSCGFDEAWKDVPDI